MHRQLFLFALTLAALGQLPLAAQLSTGSLQGAYYVRQIAMDGYPTYDAFSAQGTATFDGNGNFTFQGTGIDTTQSSATPRNITVNGKYTLTSGGILSITSLVDTTETVYGGFANKMVVASSTESSYYDLLVAIPASQSVTNSTLKGDYRFVSMDFPNGAYESVRNGTFTATADGQGSLGTLSITGQAANLSTPTTTQSISGASYSLTGNGSGTLTLPTSGDANSLLISGNKTLYVSADGNFVLGGSANGYDMILGVKTLSGGVSSSTFKGTYFLGGMEIDNTQGDIVNTSQLLGYSGSMKANGQGTYISNTRYNFDGFAPFDETFADENAMPDSSGLLDFKHYQFYFGADGQIVLATGKSDNYEIDLAIRAQTFTGPGVFLDPTGVANAASFAPITNPIAPGELITLFGSGLASETVVAPGLPFPPTLGNVQVTINGTPAPIYYVTPTQISVVVPYSIPTTGAFANIQVTNNGTQSNVVQVYTAPTAPGIFSQSQGGTGTGAILRQNYSVVSSSNPATKGETLQIFLTGLGAVSPATPAGAAGPSTPPLSEATGNVTVYIDGQEATVSYAGLAPGLAGLYQVNAVIPKTANSGDVFVDIATDDAYHTQVTVPVQ